MSLYCEMPEFYTVTEPVARAARACCECPVPIEKGEKYVRCSGKWEGGMMKKVLTESQIAKIDKRCAKATSEKIAEWWAKTNRWIFPNDLIKPTLDSRDAAGHAWEIINKHIGRVGERLVNQAWCNEHPGIMEMCREKGCDQIASYGKKTGEAICRYCYSKKRLAKALGVEVGKEKQ